MNKLNLSLAAALLSFSTQAQVNKVSNPSFEDMDKKIVKLGQIENVLEWAEPTGCAMPDIFTTDTKKPEVGVPLNVRGRAEAHEGKAYTGILTYSEREASPRQYLQAKLNGKLLPGKKYCLRFYASLSDISKYGSNGLGMYISSKLPKQKEIEAYDIKPQITYFNDMVIEDMFEWVSICGEYEADGTEKYITIGNFLPQSAVQTKKMRRPVEFKVPQTKDAYYYIDEVSVIALGHLDAPCNCVVKDDTPELAVSYTKNVSVEGTTAADKLKLMAIHYDFESTELSAEDKEKVNEIALLLNENANLSIEIQGHTDPSERDEVAESRAKAVFAYLTTEKNINASRLDYKGYGSTTLAEEGEDAHAKAQNRRVEFKAK
jgi:outer membrane protein OmpA-like peptidoglycan-associated protein